MLNDQSYTEKHLRSLHRELERLRQRQKNPPVHELHPPIQRGWKRHFVMPHATRERPDAALLETILVQLNTVRFFWRPDFKHTRRHGGRRDPVEIEQQLMAIASHRWEEDKIPSEWRRYFRIDLVPDLFVREICRGCVRSRRWSNPIFLAQRRGYVWAYAFRFPALFELRVERHWLTHFTVIEPEVEERVAEIERWMEHHHGYKRFQRLQGRSQHKWRGTDKPRRCKAEQARREIRAHLGFLKNEPAEDISSISPCWGARRVGCLLPVRLVLDGGTDSLVRHIEAMERQRNITTPRRTGTSGMKDQTPTFYTYKFSSSPQTLRSTWTRF